MKKQNTRKLNIQTKTIIIISAFALFVSAIAMFFFSFVTIKNNNENYRSKASELSETIAEMMSIKTDEIKDVKNEIMTIFNDPSVTPVYSDDMDTPEWDEYMAHFANVPNNANYQSLLNILRRVSSKSDGEVKSIYLSFIIKNDKATAFAYLVDSSTEDQCLPGCIDQLYDVNREILEKPMRGFPAYITSTEAYGWLSTSGSPIVDGDEVVAYAMVDISMTAVHARQNSLILRFAGYLFGTIILLCVVGFFIVRHLLVKPINRLIDATQSFDSKNPDPNREVFSNAGITTGDELEILVDSMAEMERNINHKIAELIELNEQLQKTEQRVDEMSAIINKDALTGVRNKTAYDAMIAHLKMRLDTETEVEFGLAMIDLNDLKVINDKYGHSSGDIALIKLANIICTIFAHSPVFRYGGDEFIVFLQNVDYRKINKLEKEFNRKIDELQKDVYLQPFEKISAALGYALYNPKIDNGVEDVFKRADEAMYNRKHEMKK